MNIESPKREGDKRVDIEVGIKNKKGFTDEEVGIITEIISRILYYAGYEEFKIEEYPYEYTSDFFDIMSHIHQELGNNPQLMDIVKLLEEEREKEV